MVTSEPDAVFRVRLPPVDRPAATLEEWYREALADLLQIVRLYSRGKPVSVDAFAFHNRLDRQIPILGEGPHDEA